MNPSPRIRTAFFSENPELVAKVWPKPQREKLAAVVEFPAETVTTASMRDHADWLKETRVLFSTWGMPKLTSEQLAMMPKLEAVFYAAGTIKQFAEPLFDHNITVVSAWAANAVPVAEFTLSQIIYSLKLGWNSQRAFTGVPGPESWTRSEIPGVYGTTVGIISLGMIGRKLCELLEPFRLQKLAFDPFVDDATLSKLTAARADSLEQIFHESDVVTLHAPWLPETEGMVTGKLLEMMKPNATFINTSRGALVREDELIQVLTQRPDLTALLDVTQPEPPVAGSPLYSLPNVVLTPHIAGSLGSEVCRLADFMIEEFFRWTAGQPLHYSVDREMMARIA